MPKCHKCGTPLNADLDYGRQDTCSKCNFATHCCLNCQHYDPSKYNECDEPQADRVVDKEKFNFCDYFKPGMGTGASKVMDEKQKALKLAEALFKKKS